MKAAIYRGVHNIDITNLPDYECGDDAVILKNIYSSICGTDVAVYNHGLTFGQKSLTGSGGYTPQDVRDVLNIMKSGGSKIL